MNIAFAMVSLTIVFLINFIYNSNKAIPRKSSIIFRKMTLLFGVTEVVDLFCCFLGKYLLEEGLLFTDEITAWYLIYKIAVHCYMALVLLMSLVSFQYASASASYKLYSLSTIGYLLLGTVFILPIDFVVVKNEILFTGYAVNYAYIICFLIIVLTGILVIKKRNSIERKKKESFCLWAFFWILSAILSITLPYCCYVGISCAFGILVTFMFVENPEIMQGKHKNTMLFYYIKGCLEYYSGSQEPINVVGIHFNDEDEIQYFLKTMVPQKKQFFLFEDDNNNFYVVFTTNQLLHLLLKDYVSTHNLFAIHFNELTSDDTQNIAEFFKENVFTMERGILRTITKEEFFKKEEEIKTKEEIELAIKEDRIIAYVQPIYDVKQKKFTCGECLCRMKRKGGEIMLPYRFIGVAEKYGLICDIETRMFHNMCKLLQRKDEFGIESLEANLSVKKGETKHLYEEYLEIMEQYGIDGKHINLEITETDILAQKNALIGNMNDLKSTGIRFALDDFGTGESNLGYVIDMPIDIMKFDREIFQKATSIKKAKIVVENTIKMAHKLGIKVVVEGVEIESDFHLCEEMGVDYIQGYYFSKPISVEDFALFCKKHNFN